MRKIIVMTAVAALMGAPAFASSPETIGAGSSSTVYGNGSHGQNAYAGSSSNVGIENDKFTSWNTDKTTTNTYPVDGNSTYVNDVSTTTTTTNGTDAIEGGSTTSYGGESGGGYFYATGSEGGSLSVDPNAGGNGPDGQLHNFGS